MHQNPQTPAVIRIFRKPLDTRRQARRAASARESEFWKNHGFLLCTEFTWTIISVAAGPVRRSSGRGTTAQNLFLARYVSPCRLKGGSLVPIGWRRQLVHIGA